MPFAPRAYGKLSDIRSCGTWPNHHLVATVTLGIPIPLWGPNQDDPHPCAWAQGLANFDLSLRRII